MSATTASPGSVTKPAHQQGRAPRLPRPARRPAPTKSRIPAWPPATRARALELYSTVGLAQASREVGVPKTTIRGWAKHDGVDLPAARADVAARTAAATEDSLAARRLAVAQSREQLVGMQAQIALRASRLELEILEAHHAYVTSAAAGAPDIAAASRLQAALAGPRLTEIVGARTRAIHDLQLLDGKPTEQPEGGLTVRFAAPSPDASAPPLIITMDGEPVLPSS